MTTISCFLTIKYELSSNTLSHVCFEKMPRSWEFTHNWRSLRLKWKGKLFFFAYRFISQDFPHFSGFFGNFTNRKAWIILLDFCTMFLHPQKVRRHWFFWLSWQFCLFLFSYFLFTAFFSFSTFFWSFGLFGLFLFPLFPSLFGLFSRFFAFGI